MSERWDGPDGQWAAFRTSYSWGPSRRIQAALASEDVEATLLALVNETVTELRVKSEDGEWLDKPGVDTWERVSDETGNAIANKSLEIWEAWRDRRDPKGTAEKPTDSPPPAA